MSYFREDHSKALYIHHKMTEFVSEEDFQKRLASQANVVAWGEVPIDRIYRIEEILPKKSDFGEQFILKLTTSDGTSYRAWSTSLLRDELKALPEHQKKHLFIKPKGLCGTKKNPDKQYHHYELIKVYQ